MLELLFSLFYIFLFLLSFGFLFLGEFGFLGIVRIGNGITSVSLVVSESIVGYTFFGLTNLPSFFSIYMNILVATHS